MERNHTAQQHHDLARHIEQGYPMKQMFKDDLMADLSWQVSRLSNCWELPFRERL